MKNRGIHLLLILVCLAIANVLDASSVFVEKSLHSITGSTSVIVTAKTSHDAADAVECAGGTVTSDLRIIDAVAARLTPAAIARLESDGRIVSLVANRKTRASDMPGWVSDKRIVRTTASMPAQVNAPGLVLPDGGFAVVSNDGTLLIGNDDGSERARVALPGGNYGATPLLTADGNILVTGGSASAAVTLLRTDGSIVWQNVSFTNSATKGNSLIGSNGLVYVVDNTRQVAALSLADGTLQFKTTFGTSGNVVATPALAADNSLYIGTTGGQLWHIDAAGNPLWNVSVGSYSLSQSPLIAPSGNIFLVSPGKNYVWCRDGSTGAAVFTFNASSPLNTNPLVTGSAVYVGTKNGVYSLTLAGKQNYFTTASTLSGGLSGAAYESTPVLSIDGTKLYFSSTGSNLHLLAMNAAAGTRAWLVPLGTKALTAPIVDPEGGVTVGDGAGGVQRYSPTGAVLDTYRFRSNAVNHISASSPTSTLLFDMSASSSYQVALYGRVPDQWNGRQDVIAQTAKETYRIINPVTLDIGADVLHSKLMSGSTNTYIQGNNVVVAVLDSGVYWDPTTRFDMGPQLQHQFIGQADFINTKCVVNPDGTLGGVQYPDYCFADYTHSFDTYGHGTHVSGIISNQLKEDATGVYLGVAPQAQILSTRVLGSDGTGSYDMVIKGIQWIVSNKSTYNVRVLNLSLSAWSTVPYFVDPLDRAVEKAWQSGIVVLAAAGNTGPFASTITVPGNDPYVITVGSLCSGRTPAFWHDDVVSAWSATGPTFDGFAKPDVLAPGSNIVSYMYNGGLSDPNTPTLVRIHPDYSATAQIFRMNGTSMATAVASGVVALMLQVNPSLTPDEVKYRLINTARWANDNSGTPVYNTLQQGLGRIWAPDAVLSSFDPNGRANLGMDINSDLAHGWSDISELQYHYQGPIKSMKSDDGTAVLYYDTDSNGTNYALGVTDNNGNWMDSGAATRLTWAGTQLTWAGGLGFGGDGKAFGSTRLTWAGTQLTWAGTRGTWGSTRLTWAGTQLTWAGSLNWAGGPAWGSTQLTWAGSNDAYGSTRLTWAGSINGKNESASSFTWVDDNWIPPAQSSAPPPAGAN